MRDGPFDIGLADEAATRRLGEDLALALKPGDLVCLEGDLGAGKTTLARAFLRAMADDPDLEVPSPTFTLVQTYDLRVPVHHLDLYRLGAADEIDELGVEEMIASGIVLVEWPERAAGRLPPAALTIRLDQDGDGRRARISGAAPALKRLDRSLAIRGFLAGAGWSHSTRRFMFGDASTRAYETVEQGGERRILMNAPRQPDGPVIRDGKPYSQIAHLAEDVLPFVAIGEALKTAGFAAPSIHAADIEAGLLLLEHLGSGNFLANDGSPVAERYAEAGRLLAALHGKSWPETITTSQGVAHHVPAYDRGAMTIEVELLTDWYMPYVTGSPVSAEVKAAYVAAWNTVFDRLESAEKSLVLRDYHSPNIVWRDDRQGLDRLGLVDFQDAMIGPAAYDLASLAMDARVTIPPEMERATIEAYASARAAAGGFDRAGFDEAYAIMAAQRNAKILGIFVRLDRRDGKPVYLKHLPRIRAYFARALVHPALEPVAAFCQSAGLLDDTLS
ncbi:tRNA (adenosine(37)-N6)-threonylcarbamoyltransferase complex ATPase subunit type 1 TsaE [Aquibium carbonis]|uniref:tRNA threonylcarbamoyladenosine biosynthesis protein TsaE n=1 Tax=Aquibium carbonis TaxID=2495581 RepID=A0A3R9YVZ0_9HYPH|nr:tRNA (adenosine(37)-N6)-threonylcarbamoyltransferase complex ATPase subunit type 1 TsaE [Aquibium carbonis]RST88442.1 tRNA (adenosine(37)-N6)-threonylcarbamoyltransferase complex ATPase subunit type 1 TsaE [Aquibium carbonis]